VKVLLDENLAHRLRKNLGTHEVFTVSYKDWAGLKNGELLRAAENDGIEVFLTGDQTLTHEQNLTGRTIAIVALTSGRDQNHSSPSRKQASVLPVHLDVSPAPAEAQLHKLRDTEVAFLFLQSVWPIESNFDPQASQHHALAKLTGPASEFPQRTHPLRITCSSNPESRLITSDRCLAPHHCRRRRPQRWLRFPKIAEECVTKHKNMPDAPPDAGRYSKPFIFNGTAAFPQFRSMRDIPIGTANRPVQPNRVASLIELPYTRNH
jgi:hypothetical protein